MPKTNGIAKPVCVSGGAEGADAVWVQTASRNNYTSKVMSFKGHHRTKLDGNIQVIELSPKELGEADSKLKEANVYLKRANYKMDLLRRNYYIIEKAESCYAIIDQFISKTKSNANQVRIKGGTAWGCQMLVLEYIKSLGKDVSTAVPLYAFSQNENKWFQAFCTVEKGILTNVDWNVCQPTCPRNTFAGIGTRQIDSKGIQAITNLLQKRTFIQPPRPAADKSVPTKL